VKTYTSLPCKNGISIGSAIFAQLTRVRRVVIVHLYSPGWRQTVLRTSTWFLWPIRVHILLDIGIGYLFIYLIIEAKQSNTISKNHNKQLIIVSAAKADEG